MQGSSRSSSDGVVHEGEDHGELSAGQEEEAAAANADGDGADGDNDDNGDDSDKQEEGEEDEGEAERGSTDSESDDDCTEPCGVACQTGAQNSGRYLQRKATGAWVSARDTWPLGIGWCRRHRREARTCTCSRACTPWPP